MKFMIAFLLLVSLVLVFGQMRHGRAVEDDFGFPKTGLAKSPIEDTASEQIAVDIPEQMRMHGERPKLVSEDDLDFSGVGSRHRRLGADVRNRRLHATDRTCKLDCEAFAREACISINEDSSILSAGEWYTTEYTSCCGNIMLLLLQGSIRLSCCLAISPCRSVIRGVKEINRRRLAEQIDRRRLAELED